MVSLAYGKKLRGQQARARWSRWSSGTAQRAIYWTSRGRLFAEWDTKREESRAMRATLGTDDFRRFSHLLPDLHRHCIHIEKSYLPATLSTMAIDADCRQEARLSRLEQVRSYADGRRILNVLNVIRTLSNNLVVEIWQWLIPDGAARKIIRPRTGVMFHGAH